MVTGSAGEQPIPWVRELGGESDPTRRERTCWCQDKIKVGILGVIETTRLLVGGEGVVG